MERPLKIKSHWLFLVFTTAAFHLCAGAAAGQEAVDQEAGADNTEKAQTMISEVPFASSRVAGMGGGLSTFADDLEAAFYNPAGIGGLSWGKTRPPRVRKLYFPTITMSANENSRKLSSEFRANDGVNNSAVGQALVDAQQGKRQYARASVAMAMVFGRTLIVPYMDHQVAATPQGDGSGTVDLRYRNMSGIGFGFSATDAHERLAIGYFGHMSNRTETEGAFEFSQVADKTKRKEALSENRSTLSATGHNVGLIWRMAERGSPTLGVSLRDLGNTTYEGDGEPIVVEQDTTIGFSLSPHLGKWGRLNLATEVGQLADSNTALAEKFRIGMEMTAGDPGSYAGFALRAGYNHAGPSFGLAFNLGLIGFEAAQESTDIGVENDRVIEQRISGTFYVNVAEF